MEEKKKRCPKTTRQQYMLFLEELENNENFRCNKFSPETPNIIQDTWEKLTVSLNSSGGPQRSMIAWKKIFADWKSLVKKRARLIKLQYTETGGGSPQTPLTDLENKLINNLGRVLIDGLQGVPEIGIIVQNDEKANSPIEQNISPTVDSQPASITSISSLGNSLENRLAKRKRFPKAPEQRKNNTLLSSLKNILCKKDDNSSTVLTEINNNLCHLVEIEQKKYKLKCLKLQLKYPDIEFCEVDQ
ncbi:hypothetical protein RN001_002304 [Aquatica leii]|uniref:Regulatory protein zeste n=1 Tax=Aquatica leii TaxID=1421715 RepID=A0AAN7SR68_9COLE|nr:hypothetical protein RN001_002304 [Aquatica leii]